MMVLPGQPLRALHTAQVPAAALALSPASVSSGKAVSQTWLVPATS